MAHRSIITSIILGLALVVGGCERRKEPPPPTKTVTVRIVHGPELRAFLSSMKEQFYMTSPVLPDGTKLAIELIPEMALPAARSIASGEIKAEAWVAPSTSLVNFTNSTVQGLGAPQVDCIPLFRSPIVIATRPENREFFNTSTQRFSWRELFEGKLTQSEKNPDASYLAYSHASPEASVTGIDSLIQLTSLASLTDGALSVESIESGHTLKKLERYEDIVSNYSLSESYLLERTARSSTKRIRFSITSEQQLAMYNAHRQADAPALIALYPEEGSVWQDYSVCTSNTDWVTPAHRAALRLFTDLLVTPGAQEAARSRGFRPLVEAPSRAPSPLSQENGVDLKEPGKSFPPVSGGVVQMLASAWPDLKRPAAVAVVLDNSGSMEGPPLRRTKEYLRTMLARLPARDMKALVTFSTTPKVEVRFTPDGGQVIQALDRLNALGGSAVYDGIRAAIDLMTAPEIKPYRKSIVVLTDGQDKNSESTLQSLLDVINAKFSQYDINLMVVGISHEDIDFTDLERTVRVANGLFRQGPVEKLAGIFQDIQKNL